MRRRTRTGAGRVLEERVAAMGLAAEAARVIQRRHGFGYDDVARPCRSRTVAAARGDLMALVKSRTDLSYPEVGAMFGVDHTTVMKACERRRARAYEPPVIIDDPVAPPGDLEAYRAAVEEFVRRVASGGEGGSSPWSFVEPFRRLLRDRPARPSRPPQDAPSAPEGPAPQPPAPARPGGVCAPDVFIDETRVSSAADPRHPGGHGNDDGRGEG